MINDTQIRLGNYIRLVYSDGHTDKKVDYSTFTSLYMGVYKNNKIDVVGVPLTPELLVKCGFSIVKTRLLWKTELKYSNGRITFNSDLSETSICYKFLNQGVYCTPVKYLHQLQNLYLALTGKELTLTL